MKVTFIGAGSMVFTAEIVKDILLTPGLPDGVIGLVDVDLARLEKARRTTEALIERLGKAWTTEVHVDRRTVLPNSDFVVNTIDVAGLQNVGNDYEIPLKYGVDQCIGDTIGPGGLFKALRTLPEWGRILDDIAELAPNALILNYTNPMSLTVLYGTRVTSQPMVGLCHSIQDTSETLAGYLDIPPGELFFKAGGINHLAWFLELRDKGGRDLYPELRSRAENEEIRKKDPVRFEIMKQLGAFCTESSGHVSEYLPFFRKRPDIIERHCGAGPLGGSGFYAKTWPEEREIDAYDEIVDPATKLERGYEYASYIIEAIVTDTPQVIYGNVPNTGLIDNLDPAGIVETACLVDGSGIRPTHFGRLPEHMAVFNKQHMAFHDLVVTALLEKDREAAVHALMVDPLTTAVCSLDEIRSMFDEMVAAEAQWLPPFIQKGSAG